MKIILTGLLACALQFAHAQFGGKLTYQVINSSNTLTMIYYQNGNNARVDAWSVSKSDTTNVNHQDTLLFDIAGRKTTHLVYKTGMAVIMPNTAAMTLQAIAASGLQPKITVQTIGAETVNGYACTHYVIIDQTYRYTSKRDVWVTTSLGTPGIQVMSGYLYYTPDYPQEVQLIAAGGAGVVVKSVVSVPGLTTTMNLVAVDPKTPPAALFNVPSYYVVSDRSNMTLP